MVVSFKDEKRKSKNGTGAAIPILRERPYKTTDSNGRQTREEPAEEQI
jgi:hypothetical protein